MISKLLYGLQRGVLELREHLRLLVVIALLLIFPVLLLYFQASVHETAIQHLRTSEKQTVALIHQQLRELATTEEQFLTAAAMSQDNFSSLKAAAVYNNTAGTYTETISTVPALNIPDFLLAAAPASREVFIFEEQGSVNRAWTAVSLTVDGQAVIVSTYDFAATDGVVAKRTQDIYLLFGFGYVLLIAITYWLVRQIDWQARYETIADQLHEHQLLLNSVTHEFRSPLTAIKGHLSFLRESNRLRARDLESLEKLELSTERLQHLVNDFLEVGRLQTGGLKASITLVPIQGVVTEVLHELGPLAAKKGLVLRDSTNDSSIELQTDRLRLVQILHNVVNNAIKYSTEGTISVVYERTPLSVTIRVQDTGSGISAEDQQKLFQPFVRVGNAAQSGVEGSGLGMWITKRLVELLGGSIGIESIKSVGTHVVITFDLRKIAQKAREGIL